MSAIGVLRRNHNFLRYFTADVVSTLGSQLSFIAFPLLVLSLGGSVAAAGLLGTCSLIARLALRLPAGQLADRYDRRWLMLSTDLVRLVALASVPLAAATGTLHYPQLLVVAIVEGVATAIFAPAAGVAVRDVVDRADLTESLSLSQSAMGAAMLIGPAVGGVLFTVDRVLPFTCDAASYAISAALLLRMTVSPPPRTPKGERDDRFTAGVRWLLGQPNLLWILFYAGVLNLTSAAAEIGVVLALRSHGQPGSVIGLVMACAGIGAVVGSVLSPTLLRLLRPGPLFVVVGLVWAAGFAVFAVNPAPILVGLVLVLLMVATPATGVVVGEAIIGNAPRDLLGRVNTAVGTSLAGLGSVGPLLISLGMEHIGISHTWLILAIIALAVAAVTLRPLWRMRTVVEPAAESGDAPKAEVVVEAVPEPVAMTVLAESRTDLGSALPS